MKVADNLDDEEKKQTLVKFWYNKGKIYLSVERAQDLLLKDIDNSIYSENFDYLKVFSLAPGSMLTCLLLMNKEHALIHCYMVRKLTTH